MKRRFKVIPIHEEGYEAPYQVHTSRSDAEESIKRNPLSKYECWRLVIFEFEVRKSTI